MSQPLPPGRASLANGQLKDTPANRALNPTTTPQAIFTGPALTQNARYADDTTVLLLDDVRTGLHRLIDAGIKVDCIITSPPYYGQRDYGFDGQIGHEPHPQQYLDALVDVFALCWQVLSDTGSLWINIGDTYWSGKGAHKSGEAKQAARRFGIRPQDRPSPTEELLATRCDACRHTLNRHHQHGACTVVLCVCGTFQYPVEELPQ